MTHEKYKTVEIDCTQYQEMVKQFLEAVETDPTYGIALSKRANNIYHRRELAAKKKEHNHD